MAGEMPVPSALWAADWEGHGPFGFAGDTATVEEHPDKSHI